MRLLLPHQLSLHVLITKPKLCTTQKLLSVRSVANELDGVLPDPKALQELREQMELQKIIQGIYQ